MTTEQGKKIKFGPFEVTSQVFLTTPHSFALVNLKPLLPGHVLVCPTKPHKRLTELSPPEVTDLFTTVQRVQKMLARHYFSKEVSSSLLDRYGQEEPITTTTTTTANNDSSSSSSGSRNSNGGDCIDGSFNIAIQDGPEAGQTVSHVHVHIIPRIRGITSKPDDGTQADELYERMAGEEGNIGGALWDRGEKEVLSSATRPKPGGKFDRIEDSARKARSMEEMEAEADTFRRVLRELEAEGER